MKFPTVRQHDAMDCGPACLSIISRYYGKSFSIPKLREVAATTNTGTTFYGLAKGAEKIGFRALPVEISLFEFKESIPMPCILHWEDNHFVVLYKIKGNKFYISDPAFGLIKYNRREFISKWCSNPLLKGHALVLTPVSNLFDNQTDQYEEENQSVRVVAHLMSYLKPNKKLLFQLLISMLVASVIQLIFPFLTQSIVDVGVLNNYIDFVYLILISQLFLFSGRIIIDLFRNWMLLYLSTKVSVSLISDFFYKLLKLPMSFFDSRSTGDILQRISDHSRIRDFLTGTSITTIFSFLNMIILSLVLFWFSPTIFLVYVIFTGLYLIWIVVFLKRRKILDHKEFKLRSTEQSKVIELITGIQDIKTYNAQNYKRWSWERIQADLFENAIRNLKLSQVQGTGSGFINEIKNILISFLAAKGVIEGDITLGVMLSISYISGQLNGPVQQILGFIYAIQDLNIGLERLADVHNETSEEDLQVEANRGVGEQSIEIELSRVCFRYPNSESYALKDISFKIKPGSTVAIVGGSGSGKTTLVKLIMKYYNDYDGKIFVNGIDIRNVSFDEWRSCIGVVMQDGFVFDDTFARNVALSDVYSKDAIMNAVHLANLGELVESLPKREETVIGKQGSPLSHGERQRLLIARSVFNNPKLLIYDEATSSLDAANERKIVNNLEDYLEKKTSIIVAHRLSTVVNADNILVMSNGTIVEQGTHLELMKSKGAYYNLVNHQVNLNN